MSALVTTLTEYTTNGNSRTYSVSGHTISKPKLVIQKRRVPSGSQTTGETSIQVVYGTEDADGAILPSKVLFTASVRYPIDTADTSVADALAVFQDIVQSDEFAALISGLTFIV